MSLVLIPLLPLISAALVGAVGLSRFSRSKGLVSGLALAGPGAAAAIALYKVFLFIGDPTIVETAEYRWVYLAGEIQIESALILDSLSALMVSFVTFIGFLIHLYSTSYMHHEPDKGYARYFAYLNLFMFSMLTLILARDLPLMFLGWEGVGLCSYLLIGYYFDKDFAHQAGKKAFLVNRIGDLGFLFGMLVLWSKYKTFEIPHLVTMMLQQPDWITEPTGSWGMSAATLAGVLLFIGACGKSAQIPLYVWLPDAMAGPTPVSALIHAATMVTAGVYMVTRLNVLYRLSPEASMVVAVVGCATALLAAVIALGQNDIKKVLAYSTVSQLGYMFLGCGVGGFVWGIFHVFTHAFFKACLFLGSGSVIHAMGGEQDIQKMGGLAKKLPITSATFTIATFAIAGFPPFLVAGFFSKDGILASALAGGHPVLFGLATFGAGMTAFYMFRLTLRTFAGEFRGTEEQAHHLHESPWPMTLPLILLAIGSICAGWINLGGKLEAFLKPIFPEIPAIEAAHVVGDHHAAHTIAAVASTIVALGGILLAWMFYGRRQTAGQAPMRLAAAFPGAHSAIVGKLYVDELYDQLIVSPLSRGARFLWKWIDDLLIDGIVNAASLIVEIVGDLSRFFTTGRLRDYAFAIAIGAFLLALWTLGI